MLWFFLQEAAKATKVPLTAVTLANGSGKGAAAPAQPAASVPAASTPADGAVKIEMEQLQALLASAKEAQQQYSTFTQEQVGAGAGRLHGAFA